MSLSVPSVEEIEARLADLRARRAVLDRAIADHLLYLELGRRLAGDATVPAPAPDERAGPRPRDVPDVTGAASREDGDADRRLPPMADTPRTDEEATAGGRPDPPKTAQTASAETPARPARSRPRAGTPGRLPAAPSPVAFAADPAGARRYGRALVEAALATLAAAGRPMHAGEILEHLAARGFVLPGRDPVAALNTRLWKRAVPGGPLRRLGEAVYALSETRASG